MGSLPAISAAHRLPRRLNSVKRMAVLWTSCALGRMDVSFCRCRVKFSVGRVRIRVGISVRITVRVGCPHRSTGAQCWKNARIYRNRREEQLYGLPVLYMYTA